MLLTAAVLLIVVGVLHSVLGELFVLRPLLAAPGWRVRLPRRHAEGLLRGAWHLTSIAWWAAAGVLLGGSAPVVVGVMCLASAALFFAIVRWHLAWPLFTAAGLLSLAAVGAVPATVWWLLAGLAVLAATVAAGFHVAWATGATLGAADVLPQRAGSRERLAEPGPLPTLAVAAALSVYVVVVLALVLGADGWWWTWCGVAALAILLARVVGEGRYVGVLKRVRDTGFARADDRRWTPAVALLATGMGASLALGA
ncbi:hypothetical protein GCM10009718_21530 [Isoptericola halotolerans]|uniref:Uncharacterized protein n=1 Tax=Isoptericola halotolerans TaxID=300560 RepID=A0ABX2A9Y3_9MICO|nr:DUF3995 domain-containing protein [Isoptericola halotolerans]NOV98913.1 hypothetical protein [Isoptericola halotolerans]